MKLNSVCILILNYMSYVDTINYVDNLSNQKKINISILIVDNCSLNESFRILSEKYIYSKNIKVIKSDRNGGYAYGNNFGLKYLEKVSVDYIIVSNNDIYIENDLLVSELISNYQSLDRPAFISPVMFEDGEKSTLPAWKMPTLIDDIFGSLRILDVFSRRSYDYIEKADSLDVDCLPGSFFLGKKQVFYDLDLFDENTFLYMEEAILAQKVKLLKLNNYLITSLKYEHFHSKTISSLLNAFVMRRHLIDSRIYYHREYLKTNSIGIVLLGVLFQLWKVETTILLVAKKILKI